MNRTLILTLAFTFLLSGAQAVCAGGDEADGQKQIVIALTTDEFELTETDISHLAVGEAETIRTGSGKTIDLLRTVDGVEIYVDGELLDMGLQGLGESVDPDVIHKHIEIQCDDDSDECETWAWHSDGDIDLEALHGEEHGVITIHRGHADGEHEISITEDVDVHAGGHGRKIIVVRKAGEEI
jgi:hypothetical protein